MGVDTAAELLINGQFVTQLYSAFRYSNSDVLVGHMLMLTDVSCCKHEMVLLAHWSKS